MADASGRWMGPAVPSRLAVPSPGSFAVTLKGNECIHAKFFSRRSTSSYTRAGSPPRLTVIWP